MIVILSDRPNRRSGICASMSQCACAAITQTMLHIAHRCAELTSTVQPVHTITDSIIETNCAIKKPAQ